MRFGGVQWTTDFQLQPNFVSFSRPSARGEATLPSTIDLYVNNVQRMHREVQPGPFEIANVPVVTGQGEVRMVVRDLLGREQVVRMPYFVSPTLLKPGLRDESYEIGKLREGYGSLGTHYGRPFLTATNQVGVTDAFTREWRLELMRGQQAFGAGGVLALPDIGKLELNGVVSQRSGVWGGLVSAQAEHFAESFNYGARVQYSQRHFAQIGSSVGTTPRLSAGAYAGASWGNNGLSASITQQASWEGHSIRVLSVNNSVRLGGSDSLNFYALRSISDRSNVSVGIVMIHVFDARTSGSADFTKSGTQRQNSVQLQQSAPAGAGFGWRLQADRSQTERMSAAGTWRSALGDVSSDFNRSGGVDSYRAGLSGGMAFLGGGVFPGRRVDESFAVVKVGDYGGVRVSRANNELGRTDSHGRLLVPGLLPYQPNAIQIEQADLPLDAEVGELALELTPGRRTGVLVDLKVRKVRSVEFRMLGENGEPITAGTLVTLGHSGQTYPVGYGGQVFISDLNAEGTMPLTIENPPCQASITLPAGGAGSAELEDVICKRPPK
ncbi:fimbria/pilus outer membrane usher protein [Aquabacterium sp.]|uniref:fimbria/pilus outer membrane usher protein n=1 Tax=Aquabacterium sp. TaxID=1872578 RepID=UPI00198B524D|nr:fimbria/pilus outer membrane usher protein [Aquabacterium sp.]MBC7700632.1 fimbrial biogenesis outer membrane usher protein [Aquabacterium sp.]